MALCIDVSNYTGPIDAVRAAALREAGVRRVVAGTQDPLPPYPPGAMHAQVPALLDAGLEVEAYVYLWLGDDTAAQVRDARARLARWGDRIERLWLDVEDTSARHLSSAERVQAVRLAVDACEGTPAGIYTAAWWWRPNTDDSTAFAHLPLWAAQYDGIADLSVTPFGGWAAAAMKQYEAGASLAGVHPLDLNWYEEAASAPGPAADAPTQRLEAAGGIEGGGTPGVELLSESEFCWAYFALYRGFPPAALPVRFRWGAPVRNEAGEQVHSLIVSGRR